MGKSSALMERWAARWRWTERVRAHDDSLESKKTEAVESVAIEAYRRLEEEIIGVIDRLIEMSKRGGDPVKLRACEAILDRYGIIVRKELVIKGDENSPIRYVLEVPQKVIDSEAWQKTYGQRRIAAAVDAEILETVGVDV